MRSLGIDTSNYTTSVAVVEDGAVRQYRRLLPVPEGKRGLRQSEAVFLHTAALPELLEQAFSEFGAPEDVYKRQERTRAGKLERENRGLAERARQYDESTRQIADTIVKARVDADAITQNALKNADVIRKNVAEEIGGITSAVAALRRDYAEMRRSVEERMENLSAELQKGEESIGTMEAKFQVLAGNVSVEE